MTTLLALALAVAAAPANRVVVLTLGDREGGWLAVERRIQAELELLSIEVVVVPAPALDPESMLASLARLAQENSAAASICLLREGREGLVRLWVGDLVTGKSLVRDVRVGRTDSPDVVAQAAFRAVELLQASFAEVLVRPRRSEAPQPAPVVALLLPDAAPAPAPRGLVGFCALVGVPSGSFSVLGGFGLALGWRPLEALRLEVVLQLLPLGGAIEDRRARAQLSVAMAQVGAHWEPLARGKVWPSLGLAVGAVVAWARATPTPGFEARNAMTATSLVLATVGVGARPWAHWELALEADVGVALPAVRVLFEGEPRAVFGSPLISTRLSLRRTFP